MISFTVKENQLEPAVAFLNTIPEFHEPVVLSHVIARLENAPHLILTAHAEEDVIGCKIGYERDGKFYSWLGAVHPAWRQRRIAKTLAQGQESWAKGHGYSMLWMKTRNCFPEMIIMALNSGFKIVRIEPRDVIPDHRIVLEKSL